MSSLGSFWRLLAGLSLAVSALAQAQTYPSKPIRMIVPSQAGGPTDVVARYYAARLSRELGEAIFIENRVGAGGNVGTVAAAKAAPDGYTIALGNAATHGMNATYYANPGYDPVNDFVPIGMLGVTNVALGVSPKLGVRTLRELVAKSKTDRINIALPSTTSLVVNDILVRRLRDDGGAVQGLPCGTG